MGLSQVEKKRRLRVMARNYVDMRNGVYQWPPGTRGGATTKDGRPRVSRAELLRSAGYSVNYRNSGAPLFTDPYFKQQVGLEFARREQAFQLVNPQVNQTLLTGSALMAEIAVRAAHDPGSFTNEQLLKYGPLIYEKGLELEARKKADEEAGKVLEPGEVRALFGRGAELTAEQRADLEKGLNERSEERAEKISLLVSAATTIESAEDLEAEEDEVVDAALAD